VCDYKKVAEIIPKELLNEIQRGNCIPFIGSGVTAESDVGIPTGSELAILLARECEKRSKSKITFDNIQHEGLEKLADRFINIIEVEQSNRGRPELEIFLQKTIPAHGFNPPASGKSSFPFLVNIPWRKNSAPIIITTNWDEMIEKSVDDYTNDKYDQITTSDEIQKLGVNLNRYKIIKIHGTIKSPKELLITQSDFDNLLAKISDNLLYRKVVDYLTTHTFVFVGYNLEDVPFRTVKAFVDQNLNRPEYRQTKTHYAILGENPDPQKKAMWLKRGVQILPIKARDFFQYIYSETNRFVNRDEQRSLRRLEREPLCAFVGPAGVGKTYLLEQIINDLEANNGQAVHYYDYHLYFRFLARDPRSPEEVCKELLDKFEHATGLVISSGPSTGLDMYQSNRERAKQIRDNLRKSCLLLLDCTGEINDEIIEILEILFENARIGEGINAIVASRIPLDWKSSARRVFNRNTEWLEPFNEKYIERCLRFQALLTADCDVGKCQQLSSCGKELFKLTRGLPYALKMVLNDLSKDPQNISSDRQILNHIRYHSRRLNDTVVEEVVRQKILSEVDASLIEILHHLLCIFRKIDFSILQDLISSSFWDKNWLSVLKTDMLILRELRVYYIANYLQKEGIHPPIYYIDPVIRRLFFQHMKNHNQKRFSEINQFAFEMFSRFASKFSDEWQRTYFIEGLFHQLHVLAHQHQQRLTLFQKISISLEEYLKKLASTQPVGINTLQDKFRLEIERDQEFMDDFINIIGDQEYDQFLDLINKVSR